MTSEILIDFIKKNSGAAVAILLLYINNGKLESRLDSVESKLFDCYQYVRTSSNNTFPNPTHGRALSVAIIPEKIKAKKELSGS